MKYLFAMTALLLAILIFINYTLYKSTKCVKFVDTAYIYNNFKLKQDLEKNFDEIKNLRKKSLDSLYDVIQQAKQAKAGDEQMRAIESQYVNNRNGIFDEQEKLREAYDAQIWKQLNTFVQEFGNKNNIDLIIGANGQGSVMHGKPEMNISEEVINFANERYNGK